MFVLIKQQYEANFTGLINFYSYSWFLLSNPMRAKKTVGKDKVVLAVLNYELHLAS
jgi:hypothetical protein